jgi:hypothetical protein
MLPTEQVNVAQHPAWVEARHDLPAQTKYRIVPVKGELSAPVSSYIRES